MAGKYQPIFKRCQQCNAVNQASAFKRASGINAVGNERPVRCPSCGYTAPAWAFVPVEKPAEAESTEERST